MPRSLRYVPPGGALFELTSRTIHSRFLLRPGRRLNEVLAGVLGRAQRRYGVTIFVGAFISNHFHLLVRVETPHQLAGFMQYFKANLAKEVGRIYGWKEKLWGRRYRPILVSDEEPAQVARLRYILSQGCKEGLVSSPLEWPGVNCARALLTGEPLIGYWYHRTEQYYARRRGESARDHEYACREQIVLEQLPCWSHLSPAEYRSAISNMIREIEEETRQTHEAAETRPLSVNEILEQNPQERPTRTASSPAPHIHAATRRVRRDLAKAYDVVCSAYRRASHDLKRGVGPVEFPAGCFPPRLPSLTVPYQLVPG
jgi:REP element-mobilizing transposase RayT